MFKKIWTDNVWSKVIATAICTVGGAALVWLAFRLKWLSVWTARFFSRVWVFLLAPTAVPHWLLIVAGLIFVPLLVLIISAVLLEKKSGAPEANWRSYTTDLFEGLRWRWIYADGYRIETLHSFCPKCDLQVWPDNGSNFATRVCFECEQCRQVLTIHEGSYAYLKEKVTRFIHRKLRTESWPRAGSTPNAEVQ